ncbi:hypothetical protein KP509_25G049800 [Ceratopteris richardii]|uniref:Uncharacterized protein n=2 Tax=Ceratopteris richardii TaxID=49495 RepID=A0A8T2RS10_CERRI|nr:hypothetical protein KP509_25G049800 [Ceratopteris richardii]KAH7298565.1 hypothetical protein KP509_25G049800 [Ceratopteris richardii]
MASSFRSRKLPGVETTCGLLLNELQMIWDEIGETDEQRDQMLLELEQECLEVYRRKVDQSNRSKARFHQLLADMHAQIVGFSSDLGIRPPVMQLEKQGSTLKEELAQLKPILESLKKRREERLQSFQDIRTQIHRLQYEIAPSLQPVEVSVHEGDLTQRKLEELQLQLQMLQKEKNDRIGKIVDYIDTVHHLCGVLGCDFYSIIREVHPSLDDSSNTQAKNISNDTIARLQSTIQSLREEKKRRMQKIQDLGAALLELWNLMDTPIKEQQDFHHITSNIAMSVDEFITKGALSLHVLKQAEAEVERLENLKMSKMKELVLKKQAELEEICRKAHIIPEACMGLDSAFVAMESGIVIPVELLENIEEQIMRVKEEAFSRKDIMDRIEKWQTACEEENWLEEYNKDENRYSATRGAHLNLKRAERVRATVSRIPAMVGSLISKILSWEEERGKLFLYDGVRFLSTLEEYNVLRLEKEEERRRQRDKRRLHEQLINEQETLFGTKPSPNGRTPVRKGAMPTRLRKGSTHTSRRISLGGPLLHQETVAVGRLICTPARNEQHEAVNVMLYESPSKRRVSSITHGKIGVIPANANKDGRTKITHTASSVSRKLLSSEEEIAPPQGTVRTKPNSISPVSAIFHEPDACDAVQRVPLSPVSTPCTNMTKPVSSSGKESLVATPISSKLAKSEVDVENRTPRQGALCQHHLVFCQGSPLKFGSPYPMPQEYSFEEKRLAFMYHHHQAHHVNAWADC